MKPIWKKELPDLSAGYFDRREPFCYWHFRDTFFFTIINYELVLYEYNILVGHPLMYVSQVLQLTLRLWGSSTGSKTTRCSRVGLKTLWRCWAEVTEHSASGRNSVFVFMEIISSSRRASCSCKPSVIILALLFLSIQFIMCLSLSASASIAERTFVFIYLFAQ